MTSLFSSHPLNSLYGLIRWFGYGAFAFATWYFWQDALIRKFSLYTLSLAVLFAAALAITQFTLQHSVGGIFYFFGERTFSGQTPGIANASLQGMLILRPYATFPHPNVLAGFLLFSLILLWSYRRVFYESWSKIVFVSTILLATSAIFLSLSRTVIFLMVTLGGMLVVSQLRRRSLSKKYALGIAVLVVLFLLPFLPRFFVLSLTDEAVAIRLSLLMMSWEIFQQSPLLGVGLKNFLPALSATSPTSLHYSFLQPVHNVYVLALVEIGLVGIIWTLPPLYALVKKVFSARGAHLSLLFCLIVIGSVDHYFYTLHQGQLLLALILGILFAPYRPLDSRVNFASQKKQISRKGLLKERKQ